MSELVVEGLRAGVRGKEIIHGIDLTVRSGEVHAVMGPNGSGKSTLSHVIAGHPGYEVIDGRVTLDGVDLLALEPWQRAHAGLFLAMQYPIEVPGVRLEEMLAEAMVASGRSTDGLGGAMRTEAERIGFDARFLDRPLNVDLSGGEKKRNEMIQLGVLHPRIAVLDEIDSGLDVDALKAVSRRVEAATNEDGLGVLVITHYTRILHELRADRVHVIVKGTIRAAGGPELADELERSGYAAFLEEGEAVEDTVPEEASTRPAIEDPFGGPGDDPFADPLA